MKSSSQTKGAVTLTFASVVLLSGLWALWYVPESGYDYRKNEHIAGVDFIVKPGNSTTKEFEVDRGVEEIRINIWSETILDDPYDPEQHPYDIPPMVSVRISDPEGKVVKSYDNITSLSEGEMIAVGRSGTFKVDIENNDSENSVRIELQVYDVTKVVNHPLEAMGQWLTIVSLPLFGLAVWFIIRSKKIVNGNSS
jgi:hypothetical protein